MEVFYIELVLADEPTANLDTANGQQAMEIIQRLNQETGTAFIFATHDAWFRLPAGWLKFKTGRS